MSSPLHPDTPSLTDRAAAFSDTLRDAGYRSGGHVPPRGPFARSHGAFEVFAQLDCAPEVLAFTNWYAELVGLNDHDGFSVSCLPGTPSRIAHQVRALTVSVGMTEVFYLLITSDGSRVTTVAMYTESYADLSWLPSDSTIEFGTAHFYDGDATCLQCRPDTAARLMSDPRLVGCLRQRVTELRSRPRSRRHDWHNPWLWNCIDQAKVSPPRIPEACAPDPAADSPDVLRLARQRTGQQRFRAELFDHSDPVACAICGIDEPEVLEAAHLIAHADGGSYDIGNGRLLCANHHRAFDAGLYNYHPATDTFIWAGDAPEPYLGRR